MKYYNSGNVPDNSLTSSTSDLAVWKFIGLLNFVVCMGDLATLAIGSGGRNEAKKKTNIII